MRGDDGQHRVRGERAAVPAGGAGAWGRRAARDGAHAPPRPTAF